MVPGPGCRQASFRKTLRGCLPVRARALKDGARAALKGACGRAGPRAQVCAMLFVAGAGAACTSPGTPPQPGQIAPELYELANIRPSNIVPKSSPSTLVKTFEAYCLDGAHDPARVGARLRSAGFVEVPTDILGQPTVTQPTNVTAYAVDDTRPLVMLSSDGRTCAVAAESRTGQTARIREMIAQRFPSARPLDPSTLDPGIEIATAVTGAANGVVFVKRLAPSISNSRLILGIVRDQ
ncbi:MAG: hypothetical protein ACT4N9_05790 [Paracoccaceae bacterium]